MSSPSRPASVAQMSSSAALNKRLTTANWSRARLSPRSFSSNVSGTNGSVSNDHFFQRRIVIGGFLQTDEVPQGPGHLVTASFEVTVKARAGFQEGSQVTSHRRLFGENYLHKSPIHFCGHHSSTC